MTESVITLEDVARAAGVSPSTVSRVLNGSAKVAAPKHDTVMRVVRELGYRPNPIAQGLASGRSMSIGVLTQDITSPFYGDMLHGIEEGLYGSPYHPVFASGHWHVEDETSALHTLLNRPVDALIVLGGHTPDASLLALAGRVPVIAVGRRLHGHDLACLNIDNVSGAHQGVQHLLDLGHTHIAHIAGPSAHRDARDRLDGYRRALQNAGLPINDQLIVEGDFMEPSGLLAVETLITRGAPFTAIFAANDQMAYGARLALFRRGIRVPEDVSLVGFDGLPGSAFTTPPLTTVRQPTFEMGRAAAQAALNALNGNAPHLPRLATELVVRESTALHRARTARRARKTVTVGGAP
ncbi:LacI family DNA-binding transcriptional regulator [Deinococcus maricopensis]|uniref:Transcriptional regulator, LacI family n=1 Tax=Deinococcus maricopensis (strain DSM 21211 / LMG 22137 / NRRL B-23946 / LB-34) TaxID=709986 RepID=E8U901_DEIML|nr:substrate-binding domain-containing protein [Deinococcus maricopensis]ADV67540.1 transcriptional regulator, LacI family [Deinococcus maricopensis DSM 21211]